MIGAGPEFRETIVKVTAQLTAEQLRQFEAAFEDEAPRHRARFLDGEDDA